MLMCNILIIFHFVVPLLVPYNMVELKFSNSCINTCLWVLDEYIVTSIGNTNGINMLLNTDSYMNASLN